MFSQIVTHLLMLDGVVPLTESARQHCLEGPNHNQAALP